MRLMSLTKAALLCTAVFGLCGTALAQLPVYSVTSNAPPAAPCGTPAPSCCAPSHCEPCHTKKICVSEPDKKTVTHVKYRCQCKTICLPNCGTLLGGKCGGSCETTCDSGCGECGKPREVRKLYKKFVKEDKCVTVCKAVDAPACTTNGATPCAKPCSTPCCAGAAKPCGPMPTMLPPGKH